MARKVTQDKWFCQEKIAGHDTGTFEISQKTQKALGESVSPRALFIGRRGLPGVCRGGYFMSPAGGGIKGVDISI